MLKCLRRILEMRGSAGLYVTTNGTTALEALGLVCNALVREILARGGGTCVFLGWVCAARDSKLAPRFKKNFP